MHTKTIRIDGMSCVNCQNRIEKKLKSLAGVEDASVDYTAGTARVRYDSAAISVRELSGAIESLGYTVPEGEGSLSGRNVLRIAGVLVLILALAALLRLFSTSSLAASFPIAEKGMSYGMVLLIGLLTSVHCIAMCGGINLSQSLRGSGEWGVGNGDRRSSSKRDDNSPDSRTKLPTPYSLLPTPQSSLLPGILYNSGRLVSYTAVGVAVGALGSVIPGSDSNRFRTIVFLLAGLFMVIMGINMLGLFPALRRFTPRLPQFLSKKIDGQKTRRGPLVIGILNGFMPCGPLQAMQVYAFSTGSPLRGGVAMFLFCLGTVPLMFALGAAGGILSGVKGMAFSRRAMQAGAMLVAAMGVVMLSNGLGLPARPVAAPPALAQTNSGAFQPLIQDGVQIVNSTLYPQYYPAITVQQGIPVRWTINAPELNINGCNYSFIIREYGIQHFLSPGENVIEFTPERAGRFRYSCWMSMIHGSINVLAPGEK